MLKSDEIKNPDSCLNKAKDDEPIFVLLGRDVAAGPAILSWIRHRVSAGKNKISDEQIQDAVNSATNMLEYYCRKK